MNSLELSTATIISQAFLSIFQALLSPMRHKNKLMVVGYSPFAQWPCMTYHNNCYG